MSEKWVAVFERVKALVEADKIEWAESFSQNEFVAGIKGNELKIGYNDDEFEYYIAIVDRLGYLVDRFTDDDLKDASDYAFTTQDMRKLYETVARRVSGADEKLDSFLKDLDEI